MNIARIATAGLLAAATTFGLLFLMHTLIEMDKKAPKEVEDTKMADIFLVETEIETKYDTAKPDKPEDVETPPPELPEPEFDTPDVSPDAMNMTAPKMSTQIAGPGLAGLGSDGEYLPIVKVAAKYPSRALQRGIEGYVVVKYTVTTNGSTKDPVVVEGKKLDGSDTTIFNRSAIKAAAKYKYKPRVVDGTPIEVPGVQTKITFKMAK